MKGASATWPILALATAVGLVLRYLLRGHTTPDTFNYLLPWAQFAAEHGWRGLDTAFTNYAPLYSYLLIAAMQLGGTMAPLLLIKSISFVFEFASAVLAYRIVRDVAGAHATPVRPTIAFAAVWLAPTVILNGAMWGQADALWGFPLLLSIWLFCRGRNGAIPFGLAFAAKAQGIFLGPFVLGMALRRRMHWAWLAAPAAAYAALALPVVMAGRPVGEVALVYLRQAGAYHSLSRNAANLWLFVPERFYGAGVAIGLVLAVAAGLALAIAVARAQRTDPVFLLLAASASLFLAPFLLPKMHDRYFYAFEVATIVLACVRARYAALAVLAQIDGALSYLAFDLGVSQGLGVAVLCNALIGVFLARELRGPPAEQASTVRDWTAYAVLIGGLALFLAVRLPMTLPVRLGYSVLLGLIALQAAQLLRGRPAAGPPPPQRRPQARPA
jgi:Gpi18-like mannosyltransferase